MAEKTELAKAADIAYVAASNALKQAMHATSGSNIDAAVYYIGQHAIALMKLTIEREHYVLQQTADGRLDFKGFAPNMPKPATPEPELMATVAEAARKGYEQAIADPYHITRPSPEYTERDVEMFARGMQAQYVQHQIHNRQPWERIGNDERLDWVRRARFRLGMHAIPGEPR